MAAKTYLTRKLGANGPAVSAIGFGAMGVGTYYGQTDSEEVFKTLTYAADRGVTFWDTSDVYGSSEETIGKWFSTTGRRSEVFLATKFGSVDINLVAKQIYKQNSKPAYIRQQLEASLKKLQTEWVDLYYQHRVDPEVPIEVVMETLGELVKSGKIKYIGLSECSIDVLRRAKAVPFAGEKLVACQMEFSPFEVGIEKSGFVAAARELGVAVVAYSPLGRGMITGRFKSRAEFEPADIRQMMPRFADENFPKNLGVVDEFRAIASKYSVTPGQIALAWILAEHPDFVPIPGTRTVERLEENAKAAEITLSLEDVKALRTAVEAADVQGERFPAQFASLMHAECISLDEWKGE
ncbi:NADP-dependent oxidoreductase domain-containing protein [Fomitopsis serialis]|uniref:NADP-dependent oxidoreductase domain-containing protein n=1 Tax=Fomitopsis serialis TaxID=139415 RepID=UPI002007C6D5|nr:NADP-dependent oxidoreductase domain-containing protein [Neoantrodia serialis]KAH9913532.1 NADP-dependent oxidoreductase domain-containing protein [Neoantrodia serialis]